MLQLDHVTSAPSAVSVSMRTAVWMAGDGALAVVHKSMTFLLTHVQAPSNASTGKRLLVGVLGTDRHETGHFDLGKLDF